MNTANKLTLLRILLIPVMAVVYCLGWRIAAAVIFVVAAVTDILDGQLARKKDMVTVLGKFLDPIADKMLNISALIPYMAYRQPFYNCCYNYNYSQGICCNRL